MGPGSRLGIEPVASLVQDAAAVGRRLGLRVDNPVVLKDSLNLLIWLRPSLIVARVQVRTGLVRGPDALADSLALSQFLAAAGLPVSPPATDVDPGPHIGSTGRPMTLWKLLDVRDEVVDPAGAGRTLRAIHEAASAYGGPLRHVGPLAEIDRLAALLAEHRVDEAARVRDLRARLVVPDLPIQAVHGDAHLGNVVVTASGLRWVDWEESWHGPIEWDLACLEHRRATFGELSEPIGRALAAYGPYDRDAVDAWLPAIALWAAAWGFVGEIEGLGWSANARRRLAWVAERLDG